MTVALRDTALGVTVVSEWATPVSGDWTDASKWTTPDFPNNGNGGVDYAVRVLTAGAPYVITLGNDVTVDGILFTPNNAMLHHTGGTLRGAEDPIALTTFNFSNSTYFLDGGTIARAQLSVGSFQITSNSANLLTDGTVLNGSLRLLNPGAFIRLANGATFSGNAVLAAPQSSVVIDYDTTFQNKTINLDGPSSFFAGDGRTMALGATARLRGAGTIGVLSPLGPNGPGSIVNHGLITADQAAGRLTIASTRLTNFGTLEAINHAILDLNQGNLINEGILHARDEGVIRFTSSDGTGSFTNNGTIIADNGEVVLDQHWRNNGTIELTGSSILRMFGSFTTDDIGLPRLVRNPGSTVFLHGRLDNSGSTLELTPATGDLTMQFGEISGGTVLRNGANIVFDNTFEFEGNVFSDGAVLTGSVNLSRNGSQARFRTGAMFTTSAVLTGDNTKLGFDGSVEMNKFVQLSPATVNGIATVVAEGTQTVSFGPNAVIHGRGYVGSDPLEPIFAPNNILNKGRIRAEVVGRALVLNPSKLSNTGTIEATNGATLLYRAAFGNGSFTNNGALLATGAGSQVIIDAPMANGTGGTLVMDQGGILIAENLTGNLNASSLRPGRMRLAGTYVINEPISIFPGATLNLRGGWSKAADMNASGSVIFDYAPGSSPFQTLRAQIISGFNGGAWNGPGINSSDAQLRSGIGVGYAEASDVVGPLGGSFAGETVDGSAFLVRTVRLGDANLNGVVNIDDFNRLATAFNQTGQFWSNGDFNYDGVVGLDDFNLLAGNFGLSAGADSVVDPQDWAALAAAIPEPSALLFTGLATLVAMALRRRRNP